MQFTVFQSYTSILKQTKLGGIPDQFLLAPSYRKQYDSALIKANNPTKAAVLILFFPNKNGETVFLLTKRAAYDGHHSKQISFPGGKKDKFDKNLLATALREVNEEVGIKIKQNQVIKQLTDVYIPPSNFIVTPFVAVIEKAPIFKTNYEVKSTLTPTLLQLLDNTSVKMSSVATNSGNKVEAPSYILQNEIVWGATAMMLSELKELILSI